jgi:hypothetical protein
MEDFQVYKGPHGATATLTTNSSLSSYGMPVLRLEGPGTDAVDYGPADILPSGLPAGVLVSLALQLAPRKDENGEFHEMGLDARDGAEQFISQCPEISGSKVKPRYDFDPAGV